MNFLDALPTEIWREILFQVPAPWIYGAHLSNDPLIRSRSYLMRYNATEGTQVERLGLVLVCKALRPLAEELLFTEVELRSLTAATLFSRAANSNGEPKRGYWTKRISIPDLLCENEQRQGTSDKWDLVLEGIKDSCPRLTTVHLLKAGSKSLKRLTLPESLMAKLTTLTLTMGILTPDHLLHINTCCPRLESLFIGWVRTTDRPYYALSFPNVRHLRLSSHLPELFLSSSADIPFPRLEWLFIQHGERLIFKKQSSKEFMLRHASTLVGVEIEAWHTLGVAHQHIPAAEIEFYIYNCPKIRTFVMSIPLKCRDSDVISQNATRTSFTTLAFDIKYLGEHNSEIYGRYFSHERFPSLTTVQLLCHGSFYRLRQPSVSPEDPPISEHSLVSNSEEEEVVWNHKKRERLEKELLTIWKPHFPHVTVEARHVPFDCY